MKFLGSIIDHTDIASSEDERVKQLIKLTISKSIEVFNLKKATFYKSNLSEYKDARMACYYIINKYTQISLGKIAEVFNVKRRSVEYFEQKCKEMLSIPSFYPTYLQRHRAIEDHIIKYISTLN
ncbi:hypothetical protein U8527_10420 [Kordia algicida OT-1]|uniref:hypothetical protein n=1 Tax=Kordia algicida TaxID=221066 RepID=UPI001EE66FA8|nr:hypothetical protein [Kordia algicida]